MNFMESSSDTGNIYYCTNLKIEEVHNPFSAFLVHLFVYHAHLIDHVDMFFFSIMGNDEMKLITFDNSLTSIKLMMINFCKIRREKYFIYNLSIFHFILLGKKSTSKKQHQI